MLLFFVVVGGGFFLIHIFYFKKGATKTKLAGWAYMVYTISPCPAPSRYKSSDTCPFKLLICFCLFKSPRIHANTDNHFRNVLSLVNAI